MKLKDFLRKKAEAASIRDTDLEALLGASQIADVEVPDTFVTKFDEAYLTRNRAENDPDIVTKIQNKSRSEVFDKVDELIEPFYKFLPAEKAKELGKDKIFKTYERIEKVAEALGDSFKNATTKLSDDVQKVETEWSNRYKEFEKKSKADTEALRLAHKEENLNFALKTKLLGYKFADAFQSIKEPIIQNVISAVKMEKHNGNPIVLERDDQGEIQIKQNVDGTLRDIYVKDNDKLTIDKLLDDKVDKWIIKSNGNGTHPGGTQQTTIQKPPNTKGMSLEEMRAAEFAAAN